VVDRLTCCKNQVRLLTKINQELDEELGDALDSIQKLQNKIDQLVGRKEYTPSIASSKENPKHLSNIYREKYPSVFKPVPYPYTNPIRDIPAHSKVKK
tara:strand:+ start:1145 stop:1438 length:294 start_codon:yes stop_codon:yes gene_type:complete